LFSFFFQWKKKKKITLYYISLFSKNKKPLIHALDSIEKTYSHEKVIIYIYIYIAIDRKERCAINVFFAHEGSTMLVCCYEYAVQGSDTTMLI